MVALLLNPLWVAKNFGAPYYDELLWFLVIPVMCLIVFTRPGIKRIFG
jgi:hypothetical protein